MNQIIKITYETVIGLEVHLQLNTNTKIFCGCANRFGEKQNTLVCPVCLGLPGTLPVLNKKVLEHAVKIALALNCKVNSYIKFDRKNYYYPDLPKGYQISQYDLPIASHGHLMIPSGEAAKRINIKRAHLEEDAGKLIHDDQFNISLVDYNRTGTPLMEIVTEPDLRSAQEAYDYLQILKLNLQYLDVSDCDMEKGSLRCDANVSIRPLGTTSLGTKTELKNMNSFKAVKTALEFEINRHQKVLDSGDRVVQETRLWNEEKGMTLPMRSKEEAHDYRYFPEPDLAPFVLDEKTIDDVRHKLPELPAQKLNRLIKDYAISEYDAKIIVSDLRLANFFESCTKHYSDIKKICNWLNSALLSELHNHKTTLHEIQLNPQHFVDIIKKVDDGTLSNLMGKEVLKIVVESGKTPQEIIAEKGLIQVSDESVLEKIVDDVINQNSSIVEQIKAGKESAAGFLVGQAMKKSEGKGNPKKFQEMIRRRLLK